MFPPNVYLKLFPPNMCLKRFCKIIFEKFPPNVFLKKFPPKFFRPKLTPEITPAKFIFENGYAKAAILAQAHTLGGFIEKSKSADSIDHKKEDLLSATFKKCFNENKENASPETDNLQSNPIWVKSK
jgi:hypothetical protein